MRTAAAAAMAALVGCAQAQPLEFKGLRLGAATAEDVRVGLLMETSSWSCEDKSAEWFVCMSGGGTYAGAKAEGGVFTFRSGVLEALTVKFDRAGHADALSALSERLGRPEVRKSVVRTQAGVPYQQSVASWSLRSGGVRLSEYSDTIHHSMVVMATKAGLERAGAAAKESETKAKKDI